MAMFYAISLFAVFWSVETLNLFALYSITLVFQVIDSPYLVNPEWKNFIPGYLYNDSDLELTAESFYRQDKLNLYAIR